MKTTQKAVACRYCEKVKTPSDFPSPQRSISGGKIREYFGACWECKNGTKRGPGQNDGRVGLNKYITIKRLEKILSYISVDENDCWVWTKYVHFLSGYGQTSITYKNKQIMVFPHRLLFEVAYGQLPPKTVIDHLCRNKKCCNIKHLRATNARENHWMRERGLLTTKQ